MLKALGEVLAIDDTFMSYCYTCKRKTEHVYEGWKLTCLEHEKGEDDGQESTG